MLKKWLKLANRGLSQDNDLPRILAKTYGFNPASSEASKIKIDILLQDGETSPKSSAFIRLIGPLTCPAISNKVSLHIAQDLAGLREDCGVVIVQRTAIGHISDTEKLLERCATNDIRLIVDTDDAFFHLEPSHPNFASLHKKHDALLGLIKGANQVWVSAENLKKYYSQYTKSPIHVLENTLDPRIWTLKRKGFSGPPGPLQIIYMGTATHNEDFNMIVPWLDEVNSTHPGSFDLNIVGVSNQLPDKKWLKPLKRAPHTTLYPRFASWIQTKGPFDIGIAPLVDNKFNSYKSDIKCLDYLAIGAVPMVSNIDPYKGKELDNLIIRNPNTRDGWVASLESAVKDTSRFQAERKRIVTSGQKYIQEKRRVEITASRITELLNIT